MVIYLGFTVFFALTSMFFLHQVFASETQGGMELACLLTIASLTVTLGCGVRAFELWGA